MRVDKVNESPHMVKRLTGSGWEASISNCRAITGIKASQLHFFTAMKPRRMPGLVLKFLTSWLLALMMSLTAGAQTIQAAPGLEFPILVISAQTPGFIEVGFQMSALIDSGRTLTFDQVKNTSTPWLAADLASPNFKFSSDAYWFRLQIDNRTGQNLARFIELPAPSIDEVHLYHSVGGHFKTNYLLGDEKPFAQRVVRHQNFIMPVNLAPGSNQIYIRLTSTGAIDAPFRIWDPEQFREESGNENLAQGVLVGVFLIMFTYHLFLFLSTRDIIYIFYILFIASFLMFHLTLTGHSFAYLWPTALRWNSMALSVFMASTGLFACLLTNSFLKLKEFSRRAWVLVTALATCCAILVPLTLLTPHDIAVRLGAAITATVALAALLLGYWRWWRGAGFVRYYCIAGTSLLIAIGTLGAHKIGLVPSTIWIENAHQIGAILLVTLLSFALVDRMNHDRSLRLDAQAASLAHERKARASQEAALRLKEDANRQLEQRTKARTAELNHTLDQLQTANDRLLLLSTTDGLTQISNRAFFDHALATEHRRARRVGVSLGLILLDIDHFKKINDTHGHLAGDTCLQALSKLMRPWIHRAGDVLARYGGDEFVVLLVGSNLESTAVLAEKFRLAIEGLQIVYENQVIRLTASFGVVSDIPDQQSSAQDFIARSDQMLSLAKSEGRNCVRPSTMNATVT